MSQEHRNSGGMERRIRRGSLLAWVGACWVWLGAGHALAVPQAEDAERPPEVESPQGPRVPSKTTWCFRGADLGHCSSFWLIESTLLVGQEVRFGYGLGVMKNLGFDWGLGLSLVVEPTPILGAGLLGTRGGLRPRLRYWLGETLSVEAAPGVVLWTAEDDEHEAIGFSGVVTLRVSELVGGSLQLDALPHRSERGTDLALSGGITLGAEAGAIGMAAIFTLGVAALFGILIPSA